MHETQNPFIFWLMVSAVVVLLYCVLMIMDSMVSETKATGKTWFKRHICDDFPYPDRCFDCKRGDCVGCPVLKDD